MMTNAEIKALLQQQLPQIIAEDSQIRDFILRTVSNYYAPKDETQDRFNQIMEELRRDREQQQIKWEEQNHKWEEQNHKWEEQNRKWDKSDRRFDEILARMDRKFEAQDRRWEEQDHKWEESDRRFDEILARMDRKFEAQDRRWEEQDRKWEESDRRFEQILAEIKEMNRKHDSTIGALGSRWGLYSEASFRNALKGILEESFKIQVLNINEYDDAGEVFGRPDQIELDVIIKNGLLIICEIKSSFSKSDMYIFSRKVAFYEKRHDRKANRKLVISPMVDERAKPIAQEFGIEIYSYADTVELD
jgi:hypothetical protein